MKNTKINLTIQAQPTDTSCGPTCLQSVYRYYGIEMDIHQIIKEVPALEEGGTLAVLLACHALKKNFKAKIYTFNLTIFDPSWFYPVPLSNEELMEKLEKQAQYKTSKKLRLATAAYIKFLKLGGQLRMKELNNQLLTQPLKQGIPILTGLSSTYLYHSRREIFREGSQWYDDIRGTPEGHFVILEHYESEDRTVTVVDPYQNNPYSKQLKYNISLDRIINSILLGVLTYDANFLTLEK